MRPVLLLLALALCAVPVAAQAEFFSIEGRFQCLEQPGAVCFDAVVPPPPSLLFPPPRLAPKPDVARPRRQPAAPAALAVPAPAPPARKAADPILAIARRIEVKKPAESDLAVLARAANQGDNRAIELLAWCKLKGIGTPPDALAAYALYGKAAAAGVPHAAANQRLVFERSLTSSERQQLLERAASAVNSPQALAKPLAPILR